MNMWKAVKLGDGDCGRRGDIMKTTVNLLLVSE